MLSNSVQKVNGKARVIGLVWLPISMKTSTFYSSCRSMSAAPNERSVPLMRGDHGREKPPGVTYVTPEARPVVESATLHALECKKEFPRLFALSGEDACGRRRGWLSLRGAAHA
jgi:hypothetical protein